MDPWRRLASQTVHACRVFDLNRNQLAPPRRPDARDFYVLSAPDWVNVIPVTDDGRVVLIRQFRFGIEGFTLEIPGGMCDPGESPIQAAARELREETGHEAREIVGLGWVHPNPALQSNRCHSFLALGSRPVGPARPDADEEIEVVTARFDEIPGLVREGAITHALVISALHLAALRAAP